MVDDSVIGAPLPEQTTEIRPMLEGKGESVIVAVHNPLSADFRVQYARSIVQGAAPSREQQFAREKAGLDLSKEQNPQAHAIQYLVLKSGKTINLPGDIAQNAVRQLVNYIIQSANKGKSSMPLADAFARHEVEQQVIINVSDNLTFFNPGTPEQKTEAKLEELNPTPPPSDLPNSDPKVTNPPPGKGVSYEPGPGSSPSKKA